MTIGKIKHIVGQRGIALISVLLILAIASIVLVSMSSGRQADIRRTENLLRSAQAWQTVYSLESRAAYLLQQELAQPGNIAGMRRLSSPQLSGGEAQAELTDLSGRFNLNNLWHEGRPSEADLARLGRLLELLAVDNKIVDAMLDWIDDDMEIRYPNGAEDETYLRAIPPYRSANRPFTDIRELRLIRGVTTEIFDRLKPYVYVTDGYVPMNVNTADPLLLRCLNDEITDKKVDLLIRARKNKPFEKIEDFMKHDALAGMGIDKTGLGVESRTFSLTGTVVIDRIRLAFESRLIRYDSERTTVVKRKRRGPADG